MVATSVVDYVVSTVVVLVATPVLMMLHVHMILLMFLLLLMVLIIKREKKQKGRETGMVTLTIAIATFFCPSRASVDCALAFHLFPVALDY